MFLLYPLLHSPIGNELPYDLDGPLTRLPGQSLEPEMQLRVVADGKAVFLPLGLAQDRTAALPVICFLRCFHSFAISGKRIMIEYPNQRDRLLTDGKAAVFGCQKHNLAFFKPLPLSGAVARFPRFPIARVADHSDKDDPAGRMSFSGA